MYNDGMSKGRPEIDWTGRKFGMLTVTSRAAPNGKSVRWNCTCDCGVTRTMFASQLRAGQGLHCGCMKAANLARVRPKDMTGFKTGLLTVIERAGYSGKTAAWLCSCECGNKTTVSGANLRRASTQSCGCLVKNNGSEATDLSGRRFGKLSVIHRAPSKSNANKGAWWSCTCDCGETTAVRSDVLTEGRTQSCGCLQAEMYQNQTKDITGQTFGRLTAISIAGVKSSNIQWNCLCACGNTTIVQGTVLRRGDTISCGCAVLDKPGLMSPTALARAHTSNHRRRAQKTEAGGSFTPQEIEELLVKQDCKCFWCKDSIEDGFHRDHVIPVVKQGSSNIDNIVLACPECNLLKGDLDYDDWMVVLAQHLDNKRKPR